jgi:hypothetical protein
MMLALSDSFLDCLPRGGRILPRRVLMRAFHDFAIRPSGNRRRTRCRQKMAIVRVLIVSAEPSCITGRAFGNCEKH